MASGLRVAQRNELVSSAAIVLRLVSIRSSPPQAHYIRLKASSSKQTCFSNSSTRPVSASTRRWSFFSLSFLRALYFLSLPHWVLAFKLFYAARKNAVLRRSSFPSP